MHQILLYYKYVHIENPEAETARQRELCERLNLKGRIIVASEGINGTVELYVFDSRVTFGLYTDDPKHEIIAKCDTCGEKSENYANCVNPVCHRHFISCEKCVIKASRKIFCPQGCVLNRHGRKISPVQADLV